MNVIRKHAFEVYKAVFTLLLQIRRAKYVLKRLGLLNEGERRSSALYYSLKHRLLWFANTIYYYLTDLVHTLPLPLPLPLPMLTPSPSRSCYHKPRK